MTDVTTVTVEPGLRRLRGGEPSLASAGSPRGRPDGWDEIDLWQLAGLPGGLPQANYLTAAHAGQYLLIVDVLLDQQQHSLTGVPRDQLATLVRDRVVQTAGELATELLAVPGFDLDSRMAQLAAWGVVDEWEDRVRRDEDFLRNRHRYQLTPIAAGLHRAVRRLGQDQNAASSAAASLAPLVLASQLESMREAIAADPAGVAAAWAVVQPTLDGMAEAAAGWQARLAGALAGSPDPGKLAGLQDTLRRYVDMWGAGVDTNSDVIAAASHELLAANPARWRAVALHVAGADAAEERLAELAASYSHTLRTVLTWFGGPDSQARRLRRQMRDTIAPMVRGQRTLAAVGGHVSRRAELLALAGRLEGAADDEAAWSLWCNATGLFAARHLGLRTPQPGGNPAALSFWDAEPAPVETRLRRYAARALNGRPARIADRSAGRAAARARAVAERAVLARTRAAVLARSGLPISAWADMSEPELDLLLSLLAAVAGVTPDDTGMHEAVTGDGLWRVRAEDPPAGRPSAVVPTDVGRLVHPDVTLHLAAVRALP